MTWFISIPQSFLMYALQIKKFLRGTLSLGSSNWDLLLYKLPLSHSIQWFPFFHNFLRLWARCVCLFLLSGISVLHSFAIYLDFRWIAEKKPFFFNDCSFLFFFLCACSVAFFIHCYIPSPVIPISILDLIHMGALVIKINSKNKITLRVSYCFTLLLPLYQFRFSKKENQTWRKHLTNQIKITKQPIKIFGSIFIYVKQLCRRSETFLWLTNNTNFLCPLRILLSW